MIRRLTPPWQNFDWRGDFPVAEGGGGVRSGVVPGAVLRPRIREKPSDRIVSPRPCSSSPPQRESERRDRPPFEEKNQDGQPSSFECTQRSKEGAKNDAPPNDRRLSGAEFPPLQHPASRDPYQGVTSHSQFVVFVPPQRDVSPGIDATNRCDAGVESPESPGKVPSGMSIASGTRIAFLQVAFRQQRRIFRASD